MNTSTLRNTERMQMHLQSLIKVVFMLMLMALSGCSSGVVKQRQAFDFSQSERIDLWIISHDPDALPKGINQQVLKNLAEWDYPVGTKAGMTFSHTLTAKVSEVERGNTPTGFSFSAGNADPRALDYQKMDVLPISCSLTAIANPEQMSELSMGFTASESDRRALDKAKLTDHISTVCFNLLREVKWPLAKAAATATKTPSSWMPEVQVETKETPAVVHQSAGSVKPEAPELRKEIIIHNQGSPVILHFGHERR
ncbi:MAG: hypothetical protein HOP02_09870 [Methylococcaceae bacterium]|nr:hypothetical protein [Methylococcaceae bacterium]